MSKSKKKDGDRTGEEITCQNCHARMTLYGRVQYDECPHCGLPMEGKMKTAKPKRRKFGMIILIVGLLLLAAAIAVVVTR